MSNKETFYQSLERLANEPESEWMARLQETYSPKMNDARSHNNLNDPCKCGAWHKIPILEVVK